jgi:SAM-dependent methyltransferase
MGLRTRARRIGRALASRHFFGGRSGPIFRTARALDALLARAGRRSTAPEIVADQWDQTASDAFVRELERRSWTGVPAVHANHNYLVTGSRDVMWIDWLRDHYFPGGEVGDVLSLGCGTGHLDRLFAQHGFVMRSLYGLDVSPAAIQQARRLSEAAPPAPVIRYAADDLNRSTLPAGAYDFIYFYQSLHHIEALEHVLDGCRKLLRPGGRLLVNEYVGPSRFQWTRQQERFANQQLATLPAPLRRDVTSGGLKVAIHRPTLAEMIARDPSEAVRSGEIEQALRDRFDVTAEWNWGGTVNHLVFQHIAGNFDPADPIHNDHVERLIADENRWISEGTLPSDFKMYLLA